MTVYREGLADDIMNKVVVSGSAFVGIVTARNGRDLELDPFLIDGPGMGLEITELETSPLMILEIEEAEELFSPVLEMNRKAGLLTGEQPRVAVV